MAGLRPPRADSPAARLLTGGTDYRVPLTTSQADRYRQVYSQIKVRYFFVMACRRRGLLYLLFSREVVTVINNSSWMIKAPGDVSISAEQLATHMSMEALLLGSHLEPAALYEMLTKVCHRPSSFVIVRVCVAASTIVPLHEDRARAASLPSSLVMRCGGGVGRFTHEDRGTFNVRRSSSS